MDLGQLLKLASSATENAAEARGQALPATVTACRLIENAVQEMLAGEPLRGLANLGVCGETFYGARVRTIPDTKLRHFGDCNEHDRFLCIDSTGALCNVRWIPDPEHTTDDGEDWYKLESWTVADNQLRIGDVDGMLRALRWALPRHVKRSQRTAASYANAKALASKIEAALASPEK
jgi:hypothetical protein